MAAYRLLDAVKARIMQGTMPGARGRERPRMAWTDSIETWTGLPVEESLRMTEDRDKWRKYVHSVANPRIVRGRLKNRTYVCFSAVLFNFEHTHTRLTALFRDYPGEPVPER